MQGSLELAARLWRTWSRGATVLIISAIIIGSFALGAFLIVTLAGWLLEDGGFPDDILIREQLAWWRLSAILWAPLAVGWALRLIGEMIADWRSEDDERRIIRDAERQGTARARSRMGERAALIAAGVWFPGLIIFGISQGWDWSMWMVAFGGGSLVELALMIWALGGKVGPGAGRPAISGDEVGRPE